MFSAGFLSSDYHNWLFLRLRLFYAGDLTPIRLIGVEIVRSRKVSLNMSPTYA